jgi:hypothetical protein
MESQLLVVSYDSNYSEGSRLGRIQSSLVSRIRLESLRKAASQ